MTSLLTLRLRTVFENCNAKLSAKATGSVPKMAKTKITRKTHISCIRRLKVKTYYQIT